MKEITFEDIFKEEGVEEPVQNEYDLIQLARKGISKKSLLKLAELLSISVKDLASLLPITERTIQRYSSDKRFKRDISEQVILIAEVMVKGLEVFGNQGELKRWLQTPNRGLANKEPIKLLDTSFGAQLVKDELGRLEHGVYS